MQKQGSLKHKTSLRWQHSIVTTLTRNDAFNFFIFTSLSKDKIINLFHCFVFIEVVIFVSPLVNKLSNPSGTDVMENKLLLECLKSTIYVVKISVDLSVVFGPSLLKGCSYIFFSFRIFKYFFVTNMHEIKIVLFTFLTLLSPFRVSARETCHLDLMKLWLNTNIVKARIKFVFNIILTSFKNVCASSCFTMLFYNKHFLSILSEHRSRL